MRPRRSKRGAGGLAWARARRRGWRPGVDRGRVGAAGQRRERLRLAICKRTFVARPTGAGTVRSSPRESRRRRRLRRAVLHFANRCPVRRPLIANRRVGDVDRRQHGRQARRLLDREVIQRRSRRRRPGPPHGRSAMTVSVRMLPRGGARSGCRRRARGCRDRRCAASKRCVATRLVRRRHVLDLRRQVARLDERLGQHVRERAILDDQQHACATMRSCSDEGKAMAPSLSRRRAKRAVSCNVHFGAAFCRECAH